MSNTQPTDWFSEYCKTYALMTDLRCALAFIESFTRSSIEHADDITNWTTRAKEIQARADEALRVFKQ
jgi:hypothetical protein